MKTVTVNTSELEGAALDWAVAKAIGGTNHIESRWYDDENGAANIAVWCSRQFSDDWAQGGPLLEEWRVALIPEHSAGWTAQCYGGPVEDSDTPQGTGIGFTAAEALCKSIIDAVLGETVDVPEELVK